MILRNIPRTFFGCIDMKSILVIVFMTTVFIGCKTVYIPVERVVQIRETVIDTVVSFVPVPEYVHIVTKDTTSTVETTYAISTASLASGFLHHDIENKKDTISVRICYITRDSVIKEPAPYPVYVDKVVEKSVRMPMRWWEKIVFYIGIAAIGGGVVWIFLRIRK